MFSWKNKKNIYLDTSYVVFFLDVIPFCHTLQAPLYPTDSDDRPEKPLSWEPMDDMEFDDEFSLPQSTILATLIARRSEEETYSGKPPKLVSKNM